MEFHIFWLLLCITIFVHGENGSTVHGRPCFIGGYKYYPNVGFYKLYSIKNSWGDAWKQCKDDGAHLIVVNSQKEYEVLRELQNTVQQHVYVGVHDLFKEGHFFTVTGDDFFPSEYNKWSANEPNNHGGNENCVLLLNTGELNDCPCASEWFFVCEHKQDPKDIYPSISRLSDS